MSEIKYNAMRTMERDTDSFMLIVFTCHDPVRRIIVLAIAMRFGLVFYFQKFLFLGMFDQHFIFKKSYFQKY
jgi:hypothetical protein